MCLAYLDHFGGHAQAVVHHQRFRRILDRHSSKTLFELLREPPRHFRTALVSRAIARGGGASCDSKGRQYLNIGHTGLNSGDFRKWVQRSGVRPVYFIHDLIPITHPQFCRPREAEVHRERMRTVLATAWGVIGNSQATLDELAKFAAAERYRFPPAVAAWLGCTPLTPNPAETVEEPSFLCLGTIEARKNHLLLLQIWSRMIGRLGDKTPRLKIVGQRGWEAEQVFHALDCDTSLRPYVSEIKACTDRELASHLANASALLFPSFAEGFGLPLVEALAAGVPVIASDLPVFREIGQGVPMLLDSEDPSAWEAAILDYARPESAARAGQLERMQGFRLFDWASHFRSVERFLDSIG